MSVGEPIALSAEVEISAGADVAPLLAGESPLSLASLCDSSVDPAGFCEIEACDV